MKHDSFIYHASRHYLNILKYEMKINEFNQSFAQLETRFSSHISDLFLFLRFWTQLDGQSV